MSREKQPELAAVCGLYCGACSLYIATTENDTEKLEYFAKSYNTDVEGMKCLGCRSDVLTVFCRECEFKTCTDEKNIGFCGECGEYCDAFKEFQQAKPHRIELYQDLKRISEVGPEEWMKEMEKRYACKSCSTINSAYNMTCRKCGHMPSSAYSAEHSDKAADFLKKLGRDL